MNLRDLALRIRALIAPRQVERQLDEELTFHLDREAQKYMAEGRRRDEAYALARARFGSVSLTADEVRDVRGTAWVDNCLRDVAYAFRMYRRAPLAAVTIVATVGLGLGLVAVVFTVLNIFQFRVDAVPRPDEMFAVEVRDPGDRSEADDLRPSGAAGRRLTRPDLEALRRETSIFTDAFAMLPDIDSRIDGRMMAGTLVSGNFFEVLGVQATLGRTLTPGDDTRGAGRPVMVLSHDGWSRRLAGDPSVLGRTLLVNGFPFQIVGVMPESFRGLAVGAPDYWAPLAMLAQFRPIHAGREDAIGIEIVGRLRPGVSPDGALAGLTLWDGARTGVPADGPSGLTLEPRQGTLPASLEAVLLFTPLFFAFGLILLIGCANVANLLLARGVSRQREFGIRLSLGASRPRIIRQLLTENLLLALAAAVLGFVVSRIVLDVAVAITTRTLAPELAETFDLDVPAADWRVAVFLVGGAMAATLFFGLMPALQATRLELVRTMRGEVTKDARPGRARHALIAVQVTASALLLICSAVFLRSALRASGVESGLRTADTIVVDIVNEPMRESMRHAVGMEPMVTAVAASWPDPVSRPRAGFAAAQPPPDGRGAPAPAETVAFRYVSPEYFDVLGITIVQGRAFTQAERTAATAVTVVSEFMARRLWPNDHPIGQVMHLEADPDSETRRRDEPVLPLRTFTVVGIARDVAGFRLAGFDEANVYVPTSAAAAETALTVRVTGDPDIARRALLTRLTAIDPNMGQVMTMRTLARMEAYLLQSAFWATLVLGGLALVLTVSGLFSVLSYLVEQRRKEIGVRMALGATARHVARLVLSQSIRPVAVGLLIGAGLAAGVATILMATPAASQIGAIVRVFDPVAYAASLLGIAIACAIAVSVPAMRAARIDPITVLKQD